MTITKATVQQVRTDMLAALEPVLKKHGLSVDKSNATYSDTFVKFGLTFCIDNKDANGVSLSGEYADAYNKLFRSYDLPSDILGKEFTSNGKKFLFAGIASKRSKYPFAALQVGTDRMWFIGDTLNVRNQLTRPLIKVGK
jgi:hypothetical protein